MNLDEAVRAALEPLADPGKAPQMQRYMKSEMPFLGVAKPARAAALREVCAAVVFSSPREMTEAVLELWRGACYREERYAAIDVTGDRRYRAWQTPDLVPLYDEFITTGAWWDYVDEVATHRVAPLLRSHRDTMTPLLRAWATDEDKWRRRTAVICQLPAKHDTDLDLLTHAVEANLTDPDFFLRKAIGWALRQHSRVDPGWVQDFVDTHPTLSPLSRREALKHL
ncbi:DNA alkylation repair protein [Actinokineospora bangkokensis]|uniref:DNA alkylation repair protein n=1 Tax=Actinokineospora bangkokensis TaxID=1193682 RepID=A0A1Q9LRJ5_9PSEU|nr:DNA alkylation repair protein [Actinokineospora bangkokensis]OLR94624.1 DNA alkylation repair protein [Actinokineospora bangkokensis]